MSTTKPIKYQAKGFTRRPRLIHLDAMFPHPKLGRIGLLPDLITREKTLGKKASGSNREDHQKRAEMLGNTFGGFVDSVLADGLTNPLTVLETLTGWLIVDGRHRWEACREIAASSYADPVKEAFARKLEKEGIPCVEIQESEVDGTILASLNNRHLTKQARALAALMIHPEVAEEAKRGGDRRSKGNDYPLIDQPTLATRIGVSLETLKDASLFWREIALNPKTRDERMNQVFAGMSFEKVLQGDAGAAATTGKPRNTDKVWTLMTRNAASMKLHWNDYQKLDEEAKLSILENLKDAFTAAPADVKTALIAALEGGEA